MIYKKDSLKFARGGFTFIEIVIAVAILAILALIVVPNATRYFRQAAVNSTETSLHAIKTEIDAYTRQVGRPPEVLEDLMRKPADLTMREWGGEPYLKGKNLPKDGWKHPFVYKPVPNSQPPYELYSYGPKGAGSEEEEWIVA